jgi:hypothetical protein
MAVYYRIQALRWWWPFWWSVGYYLFSDFVSGSPVEFKTYDDALKYIKHLNTVNHNKTIEGVISNTNDFQTNRSEESEMIRKFIAYKKLLPEYEEFKRTYNKLEEHE